MNKDFMRSARAE